MKLPFPIVQSRLFGGANVPLPFDCHTVECYPTSDPRHIIYGSVLLAAWQRYSDGGGMLWIEGDIAIGPEHLQEVATEVECHPDFIVAVPFRLYPASTGRKKATWPFYIRTENCGMRIVEADEPIPLEPLSFGLGCTYLPHDVFRRMGKRMADWDWPSLDWKMSAAAMQHGLRIITTSEPAVHLHY